MATIQYVSDIHLEFNAKVHTKHFRAEFAKLVSKVGDILVLAGDICTIRERDLLEKFLRYCAENWKYVLYVPGNHEYYGAPKNCPVGIVDGILYSLCCKYGIRFLQKECVEIENMFFLGCTLWTQIDGNEIDVRRQMSDFSRIQNFNINTWKWHFEDHYRWLSEKIRELRIHDGSARIVVITHHAPLMRIGSKKLSHGYASDLGDVISSCDAWIFGHTHDRKVFTFRNCVVATNAVGYPDEFRENHHHLRIDMDKRTEAHDQGEIGNEERGNK
jgi:predicted phosphodiesterase